MKTIKLTQGKVAFVDDADFKAVTAFKWHAVNIHQRFYARRGVWQDGKQTHQYLHQFILPGVAEIDHRDGNGLNNQRYNLRPATHQQNCQGFKRKKVGATSKFRGVHWNKRAGKWETLIRVESKQIYLGLFTIEKEAARAFDAAARKYRGEFAATNFPD